MDNVDCVNTCVANVCAPKSGFDGDCDDGDDCELEGATLVCDEGTDTCKLELLSPCTDNAQCESNRCICSDEFCNTCTCKTPESVCGCRYSPSDAPSCNGSSPPMAYDSIDPNGGCSANQVCSGDGVCIADDGGTCTQACVDADPGDAINCQPSGGPSSTCASGYDETVTNPCHNEKLVGCTATCSCCPPGGC